MEFRPSRTALTAAAARAAHLIVDAEPYIFEDRAARPLLGVDAEELLDYHRLHGDHPVLAGARTQVVVRSRFAEQHVAAAARRGVDQYVILGAGLDSFAYRQGPADVVVFEVDHPVTQEWKRARVSQAPLTQHRPVRYVPVDFEAGHSLPERLQANGFDATRPAVLSWLGVTVYLTRPAIEATLQTIGGFAPGTVAEAGCTAARRTVGA